MIAKGFSEPTDRIKRLKKALLDAVPQVEADRVRLVTEAYKETEDKPAIIRRAKVCEKIFNELPVTIRDDELIVGAMTVHNHSCQIGVEFSYSWVIDEFDTMATRMCDPFEIPQDVKAQLSKDFEYWPGKTSSEYAASLMSQEAKDCQAAGVFTVGNYFYGGVGHVCVDYGKIMRIGFTGIIREAAEAKATMDTTDPEYIKKAQFYDAVIITYTAAINFAHRYAAKALELAKTETNPTRKAELLQIAQNCANVPEKPCTNFYEACQCFWFIQLMLQLESTGHSISPGRFDTYMYPYFRDDKNISKEFAQELLDNIWIKFNELNKTRDDVSDQAFAGYAIFQNIGVGGQDKDGFDETNDISYMAMEASAHTHLPAPSFSIRWHEGTPDEFLYRACELAREGFGVPAMYNDEAIIPAMTNRGVSLEDARGYCIIGCVEPQAPHKTEGWHDAAFVNIAKILEITLNNGMCGGKQLGPKTGDITTFKSIEDFFDAYQKQMEYFVFYLAESDNAVDYAHMEMNPLPFESAMVDDCIPRGKSIQEGGAIYNFTGPQAFGVADNADSMYAIEKNVFQDKNMTLQELKDALADNFGYAVGTTEADLQGGNVPATGCGKSAMEQKVYDVVRQVLASNGSIDLSSLTSGACSAAPAAGNDSRYAQIRGLLMNSPHFGNDDDAVDYMGMRCAKIYSSEVEKYRNPRGGQFQAGCYPVSANVLFGKDVAALPDGRLAKNPLADGVSPRQGMDTDGPTAAAMSVAKLDHESFSNGTLYNQKFMPSAVAGDDGLKNFASVVRTYFQHKGMHVQFNVIDRETLIDAQNHPENYKDLVVRVAGYSAQWTILAKEVQDDIISRTEQKF